MSTSGPNVLPKAENVQVTATEIRILFQDGTVIAGPISYSARLCAASPDERARWEWVGARSGIHWPLLDEDLSVAGMVRDFGRVAAPFAAAA